jgi:eukaryotic-like serine/threonine-protein kinase
MTNRIGQQYNDYRLLRLLGSGSFAEVYFGEHVRDKTPAAIKILNTRLTDEKELRGFINEARTFRLKHPHIVQLLDFGIQPDGTPFLIMAYAPGGTLRQNHPQGTILSLAIIVSYVKPIAGALQHAHDNNLIHRDVKPENILVGPQQEIWVSDFGIAVAAHRTQSQVLQDKIGTVLYMAPEQIRGYPEPASDQYALGITVYEWLSGTYPFYGSTDIEIALQHITTSPAPLRTHMPTISPVLEQVVHKALEKDPKDRFASVQAFANALEQASDPKGTINFAQQPTVYPPPLAPTQLGIPLSPPSIGGSKNLPIGTLRFNYQNIWPSYNSFAWAPHQSCIAFITADQDVQVWDAMTDNIIFSYRGSSQQSQKTQKQSGFFSWLNARPEKQVTQWERQINIMSIAWAPFDPLIAITFSDGQIEIWNVITRTKLSAYHHPRHVTDLNWSPTGKYIVSTAQDEIGLIKSEIWTASTGQPGLYFYESSVEWSSDEQKIAASTSASAGFYYGSPSGTNIKVEHHIKDLVEIWDMTARGKSFSFAHPGEVTSVKWLQDGIRIATSSKDGQIRFWDTTSGEALLGPSFSLYSDGLIEWSPNGRYFAALDKTSKTIYVFDIVSMNVIHSLGKNATNRYLLDDIFWLAWSSDMEHILTHGNEEFLWNIASGKITFSYQGEVRFSPDGKRIASSSHNKTLQMWDVKTSNSWFGHF